ncbi:MAG TPA: hypothetical protein VMT00_00080 [Thermoanaerobaculia bacterium]|nr:hypothetical protein [Thermoanaerobaculia bacterium]
MIRLYGIVTALIGASNAIYAALFIPRATGPFPVPAPVIVFELAWALVSFHLVVRSRRQAAIPLLPIAYILYTCFNAGYAYWLGIRYGTVTDEMTPLWWKIVALVIGVGFVVGGIRMARSAEGSEPQR